MDDLKFMDEALALAREAAAEGEVPVGCVIVRGDEIVGRGRNRREKFRNALCHAEIEAINDACRKGFRRFEFMDAGLPFKKSGYRRFILGFGGRQVSTRRWFRFRWKWLNRLACWIYR